MNEPTTPRTISTGAVARIRSLRDGVAVADVLATGRDLCRGCGRFITAGLPTLVARYDLHGSGTGTLIHIHGRECDCGPDYTVQLTPPGGAPTITTRRSLEQVVMDQDTLTQLAALGPGERTRLEDGRGVWRLS